MPSATIQYPMIQQIQHPMSDSRAPDHKLRRVVVADDDAFTASLVSDGLRGSGFEVRVASTAWEAWSIVESWHPHALVTDLNFEAKASGAELLRRVEAKFPWVGLVVLTSHMSPELAVEDGGGLPSSSVYLVKSQLRGIEALGDAVERSIAGLSARPAVASPDTPVITSAQAEVLRLLATGASTKALADYRGTTVRAVETMLARLYAALGLGDDEQSNPRVAAVKLWERGQVSVRTGADPKEGD
jgi:DNA-binding NarL/FixJ family response regulator